MRNGTKTEKSKRDCDVISYWQSQNTNMIPRYILLPTLVF